MDPALLHRAATMSTVIETSGHGWKLAEIETGNFPEQTCYRKFSPASNRIGQTSRTRSFCGSVKVTKFDLEFRIWTWINRLPAQWDTSLPHFLFVFLICFYSVRRSKFKSRPPLSVAFSSGPYVLFMWFFQDLIMGQKVSVLFIAIWFDIRRPGYALKPVVVLTRTPTVCRNVRYFSFPHLLKWLGLELYNFQCVLYSVFTLALICSFLFVLARDADSSYDLWHPTQQPSHFSRHNSSMCVLNYLLTIFLLCYTPFFKHPKQLKQRLAYLWSFLFTLLMLKNEQTPKSYLNKIQLPILCKLVLYRFRKAMHRLLS